MDFKTRQDHHGQSGLKPNPSSISAAVSPFK